MTQCCAGAGLGQQAAGQLSAIEAFPLDGEGGENDSMLLCFSCQHIAGGLDNDKAR